MVPLNVRDGQHSMPGKIKGFTDRPALAT